MGISLKRLSSWASCSRWWLENTVRKRGWAGRPIVERFEVRGPDRSVFPVRIAVTAPLSHSICRAADQPPSEDGQSWPLR